MYSKIVKVFNKDGLHARPASMFIKEANKYQSDIRIKRLNDDNVVNAKSIIMLLSMGLLEGEEIQLLAEGTDEVKAINSLKNLIESFID